MLPEDKDIYSTNIIKSSYISHLNDDCLLYIFQYLSIKEKIRAESICKNWNRVVKMSWNSIKSLEVKNILPYRFDEEIETNFKRKNSIYLINFIRRCGIYLNTLKIETIHVKNLLLADVLNNIPKYFNNLTELHLIESQGLTKLTDEILRSLFGNNPNINSIQLEGLRVINGACLLQLNKNRIKKLHLKYCRFQSSGYFYGFLSNLKNLSQFKVHDVIGQIVKIIDAFLMSDYKNIIEVEINLNKFSFIRNLPFFLSKHDKILKLKLKNVLIDQQFLENLPTESLEKLDIELELGFHDNKPEYNLNFSSFLTKQKKIRILKLKNVLITENFNVFPRKFLEEIDVEFSHYESSGINCSNLQLFLSKQKNVRKLRLHYVKIDENLLTSLSESLEELEIMEDSLSDEIVNIFSSKLSKQKNLRKLIIYFYDVDNKLIKGLPAKIEELDLYYINCIGSKDEVDLRLLKGLKNLKELKLSFYILNDDYLEAIAESMNENVKKISLHFNDYSPSIEKIPSFSRLQYLESLTIYSEDIEEDKVDIDNILKNLSNCKNLKHLYIFFCKFSTVGLNGISELANLNKLEIDSADILDEDYLYLISKSTSLRNLEIWTSPFVTKDLIEKASKVKLKRGDTEILEIHFFNCDQVSYKGMTDAPLINANYN